MKKIFLIFLSLLLFFLSHPAWSSSDSLNAKDLVKKSDDLMRGDTNSGTYLMKIKTPGWQRELKIHVDCQGRDKVMIRILAPNKEKGIGTLRLNNEMWNYLPRLEKTIKIPPSLMVQPWMGSDFANDDLVKESSIVNDYTHKIVSQSPVGGEGDTVAKIELTPKPGAPVPWGKVLRWIRVKDFVPLKEEYYNERGEIVKRLEYSDIAFVSDRTIPKVWTMTNLKKKGHSTTIKLLNVEYNNPIKPNVFSMTHLKKVKLK